MERHLWDYIVVGTGLGGGPIGLKLAEMGYSVLFVEKGLAPTLKGKFAEQFPGSLTENLKKAGRFSDFIFDCTKKRKKKLWPFIGSGVGGSSALYGMVLERFSEKEFKNWPISYSEFSKYYDQAEKLFKVRTETEVSHPGNRLLKDHFKNLGYKTYNLPLARNPNENCGNCQSFQCDQNCKNHSGNVCIDEAVAKYGAKLVVDCEVKKVVMKKEDQPSELLAIHQGQEITLKAKNIILAAGGVMTPLILLDSNIGNQSGLVGRNLMRHFVDLYALKIDSNPEIKTTKEIGIGFTTDYAVQSFGRLPPDDVIVQDLVRENPILRFVRPVLKFLLPKIIGQRLVLASILQDKPAYENRVWKENGKICISYDNSKEAMSVVKESRRMLKKALKKFDLFFIPAAEKKQMLAHVCGTAKMGISTYSSVVNQFNQVHGYKNLFVVDGSFFPTSGNTNPGLTIIANSLRVADYIIQQGSKA